MRFEDHCLECVEKLGKPFEKVHKWLDEYAAQFGWAHRFMRHHVEGVEEVRNKWGDKAAEAAVLHIMSDLGDVPTKDDWRDADSYLSEWK